MGFTSDEDENRGDGLPDITAVMTDIGIDYREYDNGNDENRLVVIWEPEGEVFGTQTVTLSTYNLLTVTPDAKDIWVGGEENGFNIEIIGHIIKEGKLGYKAAIWMKALEALGVKIPSDSGDLHELIGIKAVLRQMTFSEAKGNEKREREKPFWMPIEIVPTPEKAKGVDDLGEDVVEAEKKSDISLHDAVIWKAPGMSEKELVEWYTSSDYLGSDGSVVPLFVEISGVMKDGLLKVENGVYVKSRPETEKGKREE